MLLRKMYPLLAILPLVVVMACAKEEPSAGVEVPNPSPTATAGVTLAPTVTADVALTPTVTPSLGPSPTATESLTISPAATASPTSSPTATATATPTATPTVPSTVARSGQNAVPPQRSGFVPLDDPVHIPAGTATYLGDEELVLGLDWQGEARAYPVCMAWFHHIINDTVNGKSLLVTF